jgi:hypothetical protein
MALKGTLRFKDSDNGSITIDFYGGNIEIIQDSWSDSRSEFVSNNIRISPSNLEGIISGLQIILESNFPKNHNAKHHKHVSGHL